MTRLLQSAALPATDGPEPSPNHARMPHRAGLDNGHVACLARELRARALKVTLRDYPIVLFRDRSGTPVALEDRCAHRNAPLSPDIRL